jgi:hypothetical protein
VFDPATGRWPTVYDADQLANAIRDMSRGDDVATDFYAIQRQTEPDFCQGDVVTITSRRRFLRRDAPARIPFLDDTAQAATATAPPHWLIVGNTCDIVRDVAKVEWTQLVPVHEYGPQSDVGADTLAKFRQYRYAKYFYLPPWDPDEPAQVRFADLLRPATIHKQALSEHASVTARMSFEAWVLLHACLVRFLARDDGRND